MADPMSSFLYGMQATRSMLQGWRKEEREEQLYSRKMDAYDRALEQDRRQERSAAAKRKAAAGLLRAQSGQLTGQDVAQVDPAAGIPLGDLESAFDEDAQRQAVGYVWPLFDKAAKGLELTPEEKKALQPAGGALSFTGVLAPTVPQIRQQAQSAGGLKSAIVQLGETGGGALLGRKTVIDAQSQPEIFQQFVQAFPSVPGGSRAFKDGSGRPVQFYVDGTGAKDLREVKVYTVLEGVNPETGEVYRAPMSRRRSSDPDDVVEGTSMGELYAQADFAQKAASAFLASVAEHDDATAQSIIDEYRQMAAKIAEEKRNRQKNVRVGEALAGIAGFTDKERETIGKAVANGADPKETVELALKRKDKDLDLEWRKDVLGDDGKPYQVAYDKKTGKVVARVPQWTKDAGGGSGKGSGGGRGGAAEIKSYQYDEFNKAMLQSLIAEYGIEDGDFSADLMGNEKIDVNRYLNKLPPEGKERFLKAQYLGEQLMFDGGVPPMQAAQMALRQQGGGGGAPEPKPSVFAKANADQVMKALEAIPDVPARLEEVRKYLASDAPEETKEKVRYEYEAQLARIQGEQESDKRREQYRARGMQPKAPTVREQVFANVNKAVPDYSVADIPGVKQGMEGLNQIADYFFIDPVKAAGSGVAGLLRDFQQWARAGGFNSRGEAVAAYAEREPEKARQIAQAVGGGQQKPSMSQYGRGMR